MFRSAFLLFAVSLLLAGGLTRCAIPTPPTGGPQDDVPPEVEASEPATESVNVATDHVLITFSEYINAASFVQSLQITPAFDRPPEYRWKKRTVEITFPEPLRENTTYILTLDTNLKDVNNVALAAPITLAFATGDRLNTGKLSGLVVQDLDGKPAQKIDVFAYAAPDSTRLDSLPDRPDYRTQTGEDGRFSFSFLSEQPYFVVALQDNNRDRKPSGIEPFAVPPLPVYFADSSFQQPATAWVQTQIDSIPPSMQRVRSIANTRHMVRFSEAIAVQDFDASSWALVDSLSQDTFTVESLYLYPQEPRQLYLETATVFATRHQLIAAAIADSAGNALSEEPLFFTPSASVDTMQVRFGGFLPEEAAASVEPLALAPGVFPGIRFNQAVTNGELQAAVSLHDTTGTEIAFEPILVDGLGYYLQPMPQWPAGPLELRVEGNAVGRPDTVLTRSFTQLSNDDLGELSGIALSRDSTGVLWVELRDAETLPLDPPRFTQPDETGRFIFDSLPSGQAFRFTAFLDKNENARWDGGQVLPYVPAEPIVWTDSLTVRARWETELADTVWVPRQ